MLSSGTGTNIEPPLDAVVVGNIASPTTITLLVLPANYLVVFRDERPTYPGHRAEDIMVNEHILKICGKFAYAFLFALVVIPQTSFAKNYSSPVGEADLITKPSLLSVTKYAIEHNPSIRAAMKDWEARQKNVVIASWYKNPIFTFTPNTNYMIWTVTGMETIGFGIEQDIPFPGKLSFQGKVAARRASSAHENIRAVVQETERRVWIIYAGYYFADRALEVNLETIRLARQFEAIAEEKYKVGKASEQDVIQAQEEISELEVQRVDLQKEFNSSIGNLNALLDRPPRAPLGKPEELSATTPFESLEQLVKEARTARPELKAEQYNVKARAASLTLAKMAYLPDFQIGGQYIGIDGTTGIPGHVDNGQPIWMATIGFSLPIWINRVNAQVEQADARLLQEKSMRRSVEDRVFDQVQRAYEQLYAAARDEAIYRTTLIPQTSERIRSAQSGYQTGIVDFLTLIDSLKSYEGVRLKHYKAIEQFQVAGANLSRAVGTPVRETIK